MITMDLKYTIRLLDSHNDYLDAVKLQRVTWGKGFEECVPAHVLKIVNKTGGISAGAFNSAGEMMGFVYGIVGVIDDELIHWSDMLAVYPAYQKMGFGVKLKTFQRDLLLKRGVKSMFWTFDPMESKNAYFNLNVLGAKVVEFMPNIYPVSQANKLWSAAGVDRFVVKWDLTAELPSRGKVWDDLGLMSSIEKYDDKYLATLLNHDRLKLRLPAEYQKDREANPKNDQAMRDAVLKPLNFLFSQGFEVADYVFHRNEQCGYYIIGSKGGRQ